MPRHLTAILLFVTIAAQTFPQAFIVLNYYANTASFIRNCVNKARPVMRCKGKCQMMKQIEEEEKKEQQSPGRKADEHKQVISSRCFFASLPVRKTKTVQNFSSYYFIFFPKGIHPDIFHPPAMA